MVIVFSWFVLSACNYRGGGYNVNSFLIIYKAELNMYTIEEIQERLKDRNLMAIARNTGISHVTIWKIANGAKNCNYLVIKKLSDYFKEVA